jgi:hypothetical protein
MQGEAQLDDAEVAGEVGGPDAENADQLIADFLGELIELGIAEAQQVRGAIDAWQQLIHGSFPFWLHW